jgi:hypothetical protein
MKKIEKLTKALQEVEAEIAKVSFERKDTSQKSGRYFRTVKADLSDVLVIAKYDRTRHLNTYICVGKEHAELAEKLKQAQALESAEWARIARVRESKWAKESIQEARDYAKKQIEEGAVGTNYIKVLIEGNTHIYWAHPGYGHSDYNKGKAMPNTPKHREAAREINRMLVEAGLKAEIELI